MATVSDNIWIGDLPQDLDDDLLKQVFEGYGAIVSCRIIPPKAGGHKVAALVKFAAIEDAQWVVENLNGNMPEGFSEPIVVHYARNSPGGGGGGAEGPGRGYGKASFGGKGGDSNVRASPYLGGAGDERLKGELRGGNGSLEERMLPTSGGKGGGKAWFGGGGGGEKGGGKVGDGSTNDIKTLWHGLCKGGVLPGAGTRPDNQCVYVKNLPPDTSDLSLYELFAPFGAIPPHGVRAMLKPDGTCTSVGFVDYQDPVSAAAAVAALHGTVMPDGTALHLNLKRPRKGGGGAKGE